MTKRLQDDVIAVTGASSGIGRAIARRCVAEGARVVVSGRRAEPLAETVAELGASHAHAVVVDATTRDSGERVVAAALDRFGRLDGVVANAGGSGGRRTAFLDLTMDELQAAISTNLTSAFLTLQAGARAMIAQGCGGSLIAIGSSRALRLRTGFLPYATSKSAVVTLAKSIAVELAGHQIRCNTIIPGLTDTPATRRSPDFDERVKTLPMGRAVRPEEIAAIAAFLLSPESQLVSGTVIVCDGTRTLQS